MKKLSIALFSLLFAVPLGAGDNFVQYVQFNETTSTSSNTPLALPAITVGRGHALVVWFGINVGSGTTVSISDGFGLSWSQVQAQLASGAAQLDGFCAPTGTNAGSDVITITWSPTGSLFPRAFVADYAGATCTKDAGLASVQNTTTSCTIGPITTTVSNDLVTSFVYIPSTTVSAWAAGSSFVLESKSTALRTGFADRANVAKGNYSENISWTTTANAWCSIIALEPGATLGSTLTGSAKLAGPVKSD